MNNIKASNSEFELWHESFLEFWVNKLYHWKHLNNITMISGVSGTGKSQLFHEFILPGMIDKNWFIIYFYYDNIKKIYVPTYHGVIPPENRLAWITDYIRISDIKLGPLEFDLQQWITDIYELVKTKCVIVFDDIKKGTIEYTKMIKLMEKTLAITNATKFLLLTKEFEVNTLKQIFNYELDEFQMPLITLNNLQEIPKDCQIYTKIEELKKAWNIKDILQVTFGIFEKIEVLYSMLINNGATLTSEKSRNFTELYINNYDKNHDVKKLLLYLYMYDKEHTYQTLNYYKFNHDYDYISELAQLEQHAIIKDNSNQFSVDNLFQDEAKNYIATYKNKRIVYETAVLIEELLLQFHPEAYAERANNAQYLHDLTLPKVYEVVHNFSIHDELIEIDKSDVTLLNHVLTKSLDSYIELKTEIRNSATQFNKIKFLLSQLQTQYTLLKAKNEVDMQIKVGILLLAETVNKLNDIERGLFLYHELMVLCLERQRYNYQHYKEYEQELIRRCTLVYSDVDAFYNLYQLYVDNEDNLNSESPYLVSEQFKLITNLIGVSLLCSFEETQMISKELHKWAGHCGLNTLKQKFKYFNNVVLLKYLMGFINENQAISELLSAINLTEKEVLNNIDLQNDRIHVIVLNTLAGFYFYKQEYDKSIEYLSLIKEIKKDANDDFYDFYVTYNTMLNHSFKAGKNHFFNCDKLTIPSLYSLKDMYGMLSDRMNKLYNHEPTLNLNMFKDDTESQILKPIFLFSDLQYWND